MARPRIFVSSTYYDLKYIRASLDLFIKSLGFDAILSEKGDIAYTSDRPLDESCYREVENSDIFVLIVGGRYGSEASAGSKKPNEFFDRYESITKKEYGSAVDKDIPIYILIESGIYAEYQTFIRNKNVKGINYAHVDSVNVFLLIEDILAKPRNNPIQTFEKFEEIEFWLREQWAGLFRELLRRQSQQQQLVGLSQQVIQLKETNETLKKYLEAVMRGIGKQKTSKLIKSEEKRLSKIRQLAAFGHNKWVTYITRMCHSMGHRIDVESVAVALREASGFEDFADRIRELTKTSLYAEEIRNTLRLYSAARRDMNEARKILGLPPFKVPHAPTLTRLNEEKSATHVDNRSPIKKAVPTKARVSHRKRTPKKTTTEKSPRSQKLLPVSSDESQ